MTTYRGRKQFRFPRGIRRVNVPFLLNDFSPWQKQVEEALKKTKERNGTSKSSQYGFEITDLGATIYITKTKP